MEPCPLTNGVLCQIVIVYERRYRIDGDLSCGRHSCEFSIASTTSQSQEWLHKQIRIRVRDDETIDEHQILYQVDRHEPIET